MSVRNVANPRCKYNNNLQYSKYPNHIFFLNKTLSFATTYGGNVISHQETNKATTMAVTLVTELQNFSCPHQEFVSRSFFRRSRLFFREAAFSSGGEGCEWRALRATVGESGDKAENEFSGFIPLAVPRKGLALTSPPPDFLFSSIPLDITK